MTIHAHSTQDVPDIKHRLARAGALTSETVPSRPDLVPHLKRLNVRKADIVRAATEAGHHPALIAAIVSRETEALEKFAVSPKQGGKMGDNGRGAGPMQIDVGSFPAWHAGWVAGRYSYYDAIKMGCTVLTQKQKSIASLIPEMPKELRLRAAVAAYNCGEGNVRKAFRKGKDVDVYTAHGTYSKDVLERFEFFKKHGF